MIQPFRFVSAPTLVFGAGAFQALPKTIAGFGRTALIVTGRRSHTLGGRWDNLTAALDSAGIVVHHATVGGGEPSPEVVDAACRAFRGRGIEVVVGWGGGSVIDAAKAISAMLPLDRSVVDFLEGVGTGEPHPGVKVPYIAVPTTAGTGSEATKNAVLSRVGGDGFKKSLRHNRFVPDRAILDPALAVSCPPVVAAACGLDALTQLLESFVSTAASPLTDALAESGLKRAARALRPACGDGAADEGVRGEMAYAAFLSGVTLANAGLGVVHGIAGPLGGAFSIPHGVACGTLLAEATEKTVRRLVADGGPDHPALAKYARVGELLTGRPAGDPVEGAERLVEALARWIDELNVPRLSAFGVTAGALDELARLAGNKNNPLPLSESEIREVLARRL